MKFTPDRMKKIQQSANERRLCWLVGCEIQARQPELFATLVDDILSKPTPYLLSLLYSATYLKSRGRRKVGNGWTNTRNEVNGIDNSEAEKVLSTIRDGSKS